MGDSDGDAAGADTNRPVLPRVGSPVSDIGSLGVDSLAGLLDGLDDDDDDLGGADDDGEFALEVDENGNFVLNPTEWTGGGSGSGGGGSGSGISGGGDGGDGGEGGGGGGAGTGAGGSGAAGEQESVQAEGGLAVCLVWHTVRNVSYRGCVYCTSSV